MEGTPFHVLHVVVTMVTMAAGDNSWYLAMNIDPSDGQLMGYCQGWAENISLGEQATAFTGDFIDDRVRSMRVRHIAIVRHNHGYLEAVKIWKLFGKFSLLDAFTRFNGTKITKQGHVFESKSGSWRHDPIFALEGSLLVNTATDRFSTRLALDGYLGMRKTKKGYTQLPGLGSRVERMAGPACSVEQKVRGRMVGFDVATTKSTPRGCSTTGTDHGKLPCFRKSSAEAGSYGVYVIDKGVILGFPAQLGDELLVEQPLRKCRIPSADWDDNNIGMLSPLPVVEGDKVEIACKMGWIRSRGDTTARCQSNGTFYQKTPLTCIREKGLLVVYSEGEVRSLDCDNIFSPSMLLLTNSSIRSMRITDPQYTYTIQTLTDTYHVGYPFYEILLSPQSSRWTLGLGVNGCNIEWVECQAEVTIGYDDSRITTLPPFRTRGTDARAGGLVAATSDPPATPTSNTSLPEGDKIMEGLLKDDPVIAEQPILVGDDSKEAILVSYVDVMFEGEIPLSVVMKKEKDYLGDKNPKNLLGYLAFNGYLEFEHRKKNKIEKEKEESRRASSKQPYRSDTPGDKLPAGISKEKAIERSQKKKKDRFVIDADTLTSSIRIFQQFNGFPETGKLLESELASLSGSRCGNADVNYDSYDRGFTCREGHQGQGTAAPACPSSWSTSLGFCIFLPASATTKQYQKFVNRADYYLEFDVEFLTRGNYEHVGVVFNYNNKREEGDCVFLSFFREDDYNMGIRTGIYKKGDRKMDGPSMTGRYELSEEQRSLLRLKIRITVEERKAYVLLNGRDVYSYDTRHRTLTVGFIFLHRSELTRLNEVHIPTHRICRRRRGSGGKGRRGEKREDRVWVKSYTEEKVRKKRFTISKHNWPYAEINFAFLNYSTEIGPTDTRREVGRALEVYARFTGIRFREQTPANANRHGDIVFMFIRGSHADKTSFDGAGLEKGHAFAPVHGEVHFNDFTAFRSTADLAAIKSGKEGTGDTSLFFVALHEIGHALGLKHSQVLDSVMEMKYEDDKAQVFDANPNLHHDDKMGLKQLYSEVGLHPVTSDFVVFLEPSWNLHGAFEYHPKLPLPLECFRRIEAGLKLYPRAPGQAESYFTFSNGYVWQFNITYNEGTYNAEQRDYFPQRTSKIFKLAEGVVQAAFDTGKYVYLILDSKVMVYSPLSGGMDIVHQGTTFEILGIPTSTQLRSAFVKSKSQSSRVVVVITKDKGYYQVHFDGERVSKTHFDYHPDTSDILKKTLKSHHFGAAMEFDSTGTVFVFGLDYFNIRRVFPAVKESGGMVSVKDGLRIKGWCSS